MFTKANIVSFLHTFVAVFLTTFVTAIVAIPADTLLNPQTWTTPFIFGIVISVVRSVVKTLSEKYVIQS